MGINGREEEELGASTPGASPESRLAAESSIGLRVLCAMAGMLAMHARAKSVIAVNCFIECLQVNLRLTGEQPHPSGDVGSYQQNLPGENRMHP